MKFRKPLKRTSEILKNLKLSETTKENSTKTFNTETEDSTINFSTLKDEDQNQKEIEMFWKQQQDQQNKNFEKKNENLIEKNQKNFKPETKIEDSTRNTVLDISSLNENSNSVFDLYSKDCYSFEESTGDDDDSAFSPIVKDDIKMEENEKINTEAKINKSSNESINEIQIETDEDFNLNENDVSLNISDNIFAEKSLNSDFVESCEKTKEIKNSFIFEKVAPKKKQNKPKTARKNKENSRKTKTEKTFLVENSFVSQEITKKAKNNNSEIKPLIIGDKLETALITLVKDAKIFDSDVQNSFSIYLISGAVELNLNGNLHILKRDCNFLVEKGQNFEILGTSNSVKIFIVYEKSDLY